MSVLVSNPRLLLPTEPPTVGLEVWLADLTYTQQGVAAETMPQAIGGLATYATTQMHLTRPIRLFKYPDRLAAALRDEDPPQVLGFSCYIWNASLSLAFARRVKARFPHVVVVLGGPHYPLDTGEQERWWRERLAGAVDFYVAGEGEQALAELLTRLDASGVDAVCGQVPGVHALDAAGRAHLPAPGPRLPDLAAVPSAYLAGLMEEFFDGHLVPTVQTNRGCPFSCTFCVEGTRYHTKVAKKNTERVAAELRYIGERMQALLADGRGRNELLITDSNFGMFPEDLHTCEVIAECQERFGWPRYVNVTTGKNRRDRVLEAVSRTRGAITLSGAVQSLDAQVLANVKRSNIDAGQLMQVALAATERRTETYSEVILGLPGDSKNAHFTSLAQLVDAGFGRVNMFQLTLLPGSELCTPAARAQHRMTTRFRVVPRCFGSYEALGEQVATAEIDEVCVELPSMPYSDYRECRRMHLFLATCYNDGAFAALVKLLRAYDVPVFGWLELMHQTAPGPSLGRVVEEFLTETDAQLWDDRDALERYAAANITRYLAGELGNNLLYTFRVRALTEGLDDLVALAAGACRTVLGQAGVDDPRVYAFVDEAAKYHRLRLAGVLTDHARASHWQPASFDIDAFLASPTPVPVTDVLLPQPMLREFTLDEDQVRVLEGYLEKFGDTPAGAGRLLSKVRLTDLLRRTRLITHGDSTGGVELI